MHPIELAAPVCLALAIAAAPAGAESSACRSTASDLLTACVDEGRSDLETAKARCRNLSDEDARDECRAEARDDGDEARALCRDQYAARKDFCTALGEDRYDPPVDPADYEDDFANPSHPNPHYPLAVGDQWQYESSNGESDSVEVLPKTKRIEGVTCAVVHDVVTEDGEITEDTEDWIALRLDGSVEYFGELSKSLETFPGDDPQEPELVELEGSFKAGRDGAKHGTLFPAAPAVGDVYRQEWALGEAEDGAKVLSTTYAYGGDPDLDAHVPAALAQLLCAGDCVVTDEFTPLEPDAHERKYYAPGIGLFLEVDPESGETNQLVGCNVDPKCASLP